MTVFCLKKWWLQYRALTLFAVLFTIACAPQQVYKKTPRFFWPPSVEGAKIEHVGIYRSTYDLRNINDNPLYEKVFGVRLPELIFEGPQIVAVSPSGMVFVTDIVKHKIHMLDPQQQTHRFLIDQQGEDFFFGRPSGLAVDSQNLFVVDSKGLSVSQFSLSGELVNTFALEGLERPTQIAVDLDRDRIYIVDTSGHRIAVYDKNFKLLTFLGGRGTGPGFFNYPLDVDIDGQGNLYVLDSLNARVQVLSPGGKFIREFGERGTAIGSFKLPKSLSISSSGHVYVTDALAHRFVIFDTQGTYLLTIGGMSRNENGRVVPGGFYLPYGIDVDETGGIWIVDSLNRALHKFQYLNKAYLEENPISFEDVYRPDN